MANYVPQKITTRYFLQQLAVSVVTKKQRDEESKQEYKEMRREAKKEVVKAKSKAYDELYEGLDTKEGEKTLYGWRDRDTKRERTYNRSE